MFDSLKVQLAQNRGINDNAGNLPDTKYRSQHLQYSGSKSTNYYRNIHDCKNNNQNINI